MSANANHIDRLIRETWNEVTAEHPSASTERVIQMTADRASVDYGRVPDALYRTRKEPSK